MQDRLGTAHPNIAAEQMRLTGRNVEARALGIFNGQHFLQLSIHHDFIQPQVFSDTVIHMNH